MVELQDLPQNSREQMEEIGSAEVVIGVVDANSAEKVESVMGVVRKGLAALAMRVRGVVLHSFGEVHGTPERTRESLHALSYPLIEGDPIRTYRAVSTVAANLGAHACAVIFSDSETLSPQWVYHLIRPVLELDFDLVTPCYDHHKYEALLTSSIVYPFMRALYGKQIHHPLGPDFGFSARMIDRLVDANWGPGRNRGPGSITGLAVRAGMEICEAHVGLRRFPAADWMDLSSMISQMLSPVFQEAEQDPSFWQRMRGSKAVPAFGERVFVVEDTSVVDVRRMLESFQLGCRSLPEIWGLVLPPKTLLELRRLGLSELDRFRMPDELWARLVYDFALGCHIKAINKDHLLRSMTPLFLAWVASYALEMEHIGPIAVEERLERLCVAFESVKPYFVSRWRWPDSFNP